jgi:hypothetical protein
MLVGGSAAGLEDLARFTSNQWARKPFLTSKCIAAIHCRGQGRPLYGLNFDVAMQCAAGFDYLTKASGVDNE